MSVLCDSDELPLATNLRRLMAERAATVEDLAQWCDLDARTIHAMLHSRKTPHARTLHRLAAGLNISMLDLLQPPPRSAGAQFDRLTNPQVATVVADHPEWFADWTADDFEELQSRFGTGGALSTEGVAQTVEHMNRKRQLLDRAAMVMECGDAELLTHFVDMLYQRIVLTPPVSVQASTQRPATALSD
jgi:transcriptional regulator with XRE-family HTH domain